MWCGAMKQNLGQTCILKYRNLLCHVSDFFLSFIRTTKTNRSCRMTNEHSKSDCTLFIFFLSPLHQPNPTADLPGRPG